MPLSNITFNRGQGGLNRPLPGQDHISGIIQYDGSLPAGYSASDRIKIYFGIRDAEDDGILENDPAWAHLHYHISEFFRLNPRGKLYVMVADEPPGNYDYSELETLQQFSGREIRQTALLAQGVAFAVSEPPLIQTVLDTLEANHMPMVVVAAWDTNGIPDFATLPSLRAINCPRVAVVVGQDGAARGKDLYASLAQSVSCAGAVLGALSRAAVHENIGWVAPFNMTDGKELAEPAFSNGNLIKDQSIGLLEDLETKGYIFLRRHIAIGGSYLNYSHTATAATSDFATLENNRTMDKAVRGIRTFLLPQLNAPLYVDEEGKLSLETINYFESLTARDLEDMQKSGEVSAYGVYIDPDQEVLSTSKLIVNARVVPVGVAKQIEVNIGFAISIN
jgi:hypothetical protein